MIRRTGLLVAVAVAMSAIAPQAALANSEPPAVHGARYTGTGGLGAAFVEGPPSIFHNPAGLLSIDKFELTVGFTNLLVTYNAPFGGYGTEQDSPPLFGPLPFLGAGFRVADDFVVGLALYISVGFGGNFNNIGVLTDGYSMSEGESLDPFVVADPVDQTVQLFIAELAIPVAWEPVEGLRLAAALRIPYGNFRADAFQDAVGVWVPVTQTVSGIGLPSAFFGVQWDITEDVTVGGAYRVLTRVPMSGNVELPDGLGIINTGIRTVFGAETEWTIPHMIRAGVAARVLEDRLLLSVEGRIQLHKRANDALIFRLNNNRPPEDGGLDEALFRTVQLLGQDRFVSRFDWKNVFVFGVASELKITESFFWRFAATIANNATPASTVTPFSPPPSRRAYSVNTGFGVVAGHFLIDVGFSAGLLPPANIPTDHPENCADTAIVKGGCNGVYSINSWFLGLSTTYQL